MTELIGKDTKEVITATMPLVKDIWQQYWSKGSGNTAMAHTSPILPSPAVAAAAAARKKRDKKTSPRLTRAELEQLVRDIYSTHEQFVQQVEKNQNEMMMYIKELKNTARRVKKQQDENPI